MQENTQRPKTDGFGLLGLSVETLKGKQSVRATFQLPDPLIELLGLVASLFGVKQKSLFDQLLQDDESLWQLADLQLHKGKEEASRRPKTYVISKRSLELLDSVAKQRRVPRDFLVENSIRRLLPVLRREQEKHENRLKICTEAEQFIQAGNALRETAGTLLGKDDQLVEIVSKMVDQCEEQMLRLRELLRKGESIARFETERLTGEDEKQKNEDRVRWSSEKKSKGTMVSVNPQDKR
jgi:hypothetical protein